jgi:glycosyltransferase involved in cell wall biosynthesis
MKIGMFHLNLPAPGSKPGGVAVFVDRLAASLAISGYDVEVVSLSAPPANAPYRHRQIFKRFPTLQARRFCVLYVLPFMLNFVNFADYDVLHLHGSDWFFARRGVPSVRTFYGSSLWEARSATSLRRRLSLYSIYPLEHLARYFCDVSLGLGAEAARIYHADGIAKLFAPGNRFYPGVKTESPSFIFIGTWEGRKRGKFVHDLFQRQILPRHPDAVLLMAADFVPKTESVRDLGAPADDVLAGFIRQSWALLSASTYEGFGIPYLEALLSGTAVVTTRNSGADDVLDGGKFGVVAGDDDFGAKLLDLVADGDARREYQRAGLARAEAFSEASVVAAHLSWYKKAIERFAARR